MFLGWKYGCASRVQTIIPIDVFPVRVRKLDIDVMCNSRGVQYDSSDKAFLCGATVLCHVDPAEDGIDALSGSLRYL